MSVATVRPEIPLQVITAADVRASIGRAKRSLEAAANEIVWQIEMEAWRTLGYSSWKAMREAEYGGVAVMVPSQMRPEVVGRLRAAGLTQKEIASTTGISERQARRDLASTGQMSGSEASSTGNSAGSDNVRPVINSRGQERPATYNRSEPDDVIDAEVVEDDEAIHANNPQTTEANAPGNTTDPAEAEPVITSTCPTCHGTGEITR